MGRGEGGYALYVGRLSAEKGVGTLLAAWRCDPRLPPLRVAGDGPMANEVRAAADAGVLEWLGPVGSADVSSLMARAACLVFPSECYETFGRVVIESFAVGTPVVSSDHGAAAELVDRGRTGAHFRTGDSSDLARQVYQLGCAPAIAERMRTAARAEFETRFSPDANYRALLEVYRKAGASARTAGPRAARPADHAGGVA